MSTIAKLKEPYCTAHPDFRGLTNPWISEDNRCCVPCWTLWCRYGTPSEWHKRYWAKLSARDYDITGDKAKVGGGTCTAHPEYDHKARPLVDCPVCWGLWCWYGKRTHGDMQHWIALEDKVKP